jgi:hypothetical protein
MLVPKWNLQAEAILSGRLFARNRESASRPYFSIALKTLLYRD